MHSCYNFIFVEQGFPTPVAFDKKDRFDETLTFWDIFGISLSLKTHKGSNRIKEF